MTFDREATFLPVGRLCDRFVREVGIYMWRHIPLDRPSWKKVNDYEKNALHEHLKVTILYKYIL